MRSEVSRSPASRLGPRKLIHGAVNVILVVGHEKLNVEMQRMYGNRMAVVKIPKSGGVRIDAKLLSRPVPHSPSPFHHRSSNLTQLTEPAYTSTNYTRTSTVTSSNLP